MKNVYKKKLNKLFNTNKNYNKTQLITGLKLVALVELEDTGK